MRAMKRVLTIAGSDCSGGAGIQADIKTMSAHGVYAMSVIVSVVAENTVHVLKKQDIAPEIVRAQVDAIYEDIGTDAVKIGMLPTPEVMSAVAGKACANTVRRTSLLSRDVCKKTERH